MEPLMLEDSQVMGDGPCLAVSGQIVSEFALQPELTGGMMATSSPCCITSPSETSEAGMSTYSRLTVTRHESSILDRRPGYLDSSCVNSCPSARGAGRASDSFPVKVLAPAKYRMLKCPAGGLAPETILLGLSTCGLGAWCFVCARRADLDTIQSTRP
jgi:hypothetical protein